tara:strand:+ start:175 stop:285 length:111 start_codon:yes stop_codon:yes gene_type:complete
MKRLILLTVISLFLFGGCSSSKKGCDGKKKVPAGMW